MYGLKGGTKWYRNLQKGMKIVKRNESFYFMYNTVRMEMIMVTW